MAAGKTMGRMVEIGREPCESDEGDLDRCGYDTLRSYDEAGYLRRQASDGIEGPTDEGGAYRGALLFTELQVCSKGDLAPVTLSMAAGYIYSQLCDASSDLIRRRVPYRYVRGTKHGRVEGRYRRWDMRLCAGGQESIVGQLRRRVWSYERQRLDVLLTRWDTESRACVYVLHEPDAPATPHIVFSDKEALCRVRFRSFALDCGRLARSSCELEKAVGEERDLLAAYIEAQLRDIQAHCINVTPLRRRYRVIA